MQDVLFSSHNVITETSCPLGYLLMRIMRSYSEVDMYLGLELHTDERMGDGEHKQQAMGAFMQVSHFMILVRFLSQQVIGICTKDS